MLKRHPKGGQRAEPQTTPGPEGVPVVAHASASNEQTFKAVVDSLLSSIPTRPDPSIQRAEVAALKLQQAQAEEEAAAAASAKNKKGKKTVEPPQELVHEPTEADLQAQAYEAKVAKLQSAREDEEHKALLIEDGRYKARIEALQRLALQEVARLSSLHGTLVNDLEDSLGARYKAEIKAVDALCHEAAKAIGANVRIAYELMLSGEKFTIQQERYSFPPKVQPLPPAPVEAQPDDGAFTVKQLATLYKTTIAVAPSGYVPVADFIALLKRLTRAGAALDAVPASWLGLEASALAAKAEAWAQGSAYIDIKRVVLDAARIPTPTPSQLLESYRQCYRQSTTGMLLGTQFRDIDLWFDTPRPTPDPNTLALGFHRSARLKELLFDMFADDCLSYYARELNYNQLWFYLCRGLDVDTSLRAAVMLAAIQAKRQSLQTDAAMVDTGLCSALEVSLLLQASRPVQHVDDTGAIVFETPIDDDLLRSIVAMAMEEGDDAGDESELVGAAALLLSDNTPAQLLCVAESLQAVNVC
eukprot:m.73054 g.73054  ORF g.73054 m.73054 type:complete len:529 (-) comp14304_c0_seq1:2124-3710(-)